MNGAENIIVAKTDSAKEIKDHVSLSFTRGLHNVALFCKAAVLVIRQQNDHHPLAKSAGKPEGPSIAAPTFLPVIRPQTHIPGMELLFHVPTKHLNE